MTVRLATALFALVVPIGTMLLAATTRSDAESLAAQMETQGVTVEDLATTLPLPFAPESTTASLERITIIPGARVNDRFLGPVLFYIEQGVLNLDLDRFRVALVQTGDQKGAQGDQEIDGGNIPAGYGVYSADGNPGPMVNVGSSDLIMLAVLFVPQPLDADDGETVSATAVAPDTSP